MYGSSFWVTTRKPRDLSRRPSEDAAIPLPRLETTPPVTNTYLVVVGAGASSVGPRGGVSGEERGPSMAGCQCSTVLVEVEHHPDRAPSSSSAAASRPRSLSGRPASIRDNSVRR